MKISNNEVVLRTSENGFVNVGKREENMPVGKTHQLWTKLIHRP